MATKALITAQQYLATRYDREPELVHGELVERPLPNFPHGNLQLELGSRLRALSASHRLFTGVEVRVRIAPDLYRIPDVSMWEGAEPEKVPSAPPLLIIEVSSPDDRLYDLLQKFDECRVWGVQHLWLVEPELKRCHIYDNGSLMEASRLALPKFDFEITASELFG